MALHGGEVKEFSGTKFSQKKYYKEGKNYFSMKY